MIKLWPIKFFIINYNYIQNQNEDFVGDVVPAVCLVGVSLVDLVFHWKYVTKEFAPPLGGHHEQ